MVKREKANYMIQSVSHAIDVLEELAKANGEVGVTELSKRLKLHKNNVFRLLATLELRGFVEQNRDTEDYRLGVKSLQLGQAYIKQNTLVQRAEPVLRQLSEEIGETVSLAVLRNQEIQYPLSIESKRPVKVAPRIAVSIPAKLSAAGRLLTAQLPDAVLSELLAGNTPQDAAIKSQLNELRNSGQIVDRAALEADVVTIARVIRGNNNNVIGAIEVMIPQYRAKIDSVMPYISEAAAKLSEALGASASTGLAGAVEKEVSGKVVGTRAG
ncbi:MAG: IclR family transcriptional regulator [Candidatus Dadabacteria bacterium]|nr:MAG: IclR family transcriptional regulator [Candidatus Dadabacteria bacterium]